MLRLGELREATAEPRECFPACSLGPQVGKRARDLPKREYGTHDAPHDHQRHDGRWRMGEYRRGTNARGHQQRQPGCDQGESDRGGNPCCPSRANIPKMTRLHSCLQIRRVQDRRNDPD